MDDLQLEQEALQEARKRKKDFAREKVDSIAGEDCPVSVFMAGSPGAGKTETARNMKELFVQQSGLDFIHINNDEYRKEFSGYIGINSPLFQSAATIFVEAVHDRALKRSVSFIMDTTLSNYTKAKSNISRSLAKSREVLIVFVYQSPSQAWEFVQARETVEGRRVPDAVFIEQFLSAQVTVSRLKQEFKDKVNLMFIKRDSHVGQEAVYFDVKDIDALLGRKYTSSELKALVEMARAEGDHEYGPKQ